MSERRRYTAQEMRKQAESHGLHHPNSEIPDMLRYAADVVERCENLKARLPYPPNGNDVWWFRKLNYILRGDAGKEAPNA